MRIAESFCSLDFSSLPCRDSKDRVNASGSATLNEHTRTERRCHPECLLTILRDDRCSGSLPDGLQLDGFCGTISGLPLKAGVFTFTVRVQGEIVVAAGHRPNVKLDAHGEISDECADCQFSR